MKVFVTGVNGKLGHDLMKILYSRGIECIGSGSSDFYRGIKDKAAGLPYRKLDIRDFSAVSETLREIMPDAVIHCAAWTNVESAEDEKNYNKVYDINVKGTENLAKVCAEINSKIIYISTDYVFSSDNERPHLEDDEDFGPLNVYGRTKLLGELAIKKYCNKFFIVRTSWLYGQNGGNFVKTIINAGRKNPRVYVVNDQIGSPTYSYELARLLTDMAESEKYGVYHGTDEGEYISWYDFTCEIFRQAAVNSRVYPVTTEAYSCTKAARPLNSRLNKTKLIENGFKPLPYWKDSLKEFIDILNNK